MSMSTQAVTTPAVTINKPIGAIGKRFPQTESINRKSSSQDQPSTTLTFEGVPRGDDEPTLLQKPVLSDLLVNLGELFLASHKTAKLVAPVSVTLNVPQSPLGFYLLAPDELQLLSDLVVNSLDIPRSEKSITEMDRLEFVNKAMNIFGYSSKNALEKLREILGSYIFGSLIDYVEKRETKGEMYTKEMDVSDKPYTRLILSLLLFNDVSGS